MLAFADIEAPLCNGRHDRMQLQEARIPKQLHGIEFACLFLSLIPWRQPSTTSSLVSFVGISMFLVALCHVVLYRTLLHKDLHC